MGRQHLGKILRVFWKNPPPVPSYSERFANGLALVGDAENPQCIAMREDNGWNDSDAVACFRQCQQIGMCPTFDKDVGLGAGATLSGPSFPRRGNSAR